MTTPPPPKDEPRFLNGATLKEMLRSPAMGDRVLPAPTVLDRYHNPAAVCAEGYRQAGRILVDSIRSGGDEAILFFPVFFLYRHHVELVLKDLIDTFDKPGVRSFTGTKELSAVQRKALSRGKTAHSLKWLWEQVRPAVLKLGSAVSVEQIKGINFYIQQLHEIDHDAATFRYSSEIEKTKTALQKKQTGGGPPSDLRTLADAVERLAGHLEAIADYVGDAEQNG